MPAPVIPESKDAEAAYARVSALVAAVPDSALDLMNVDLDRVSRTAYALAVACVGPEVWPRLASLPSALFDASVAVPRLADLALGASWLATIGLTVRANATEAQLPQTLVQEATAVRARMLATCEYCLDDDESARELASIRSGTGYDDLKHDLRRLAVLYRDQQAELSGKRYDPGDQDKAKALADDINLRQRGTTAAEQLLTERRLWTLLRAAGDRAFEAARFVTHDVPGVRDSLRSIHTWRDRSRSTTAPEPTRVPEPTPSTMTPAAPA